MTEEVKEGWNKLKLGEVVKINKKYIAVGAINNTFFPSIVGDGLIWGSVIVEKSFPKWLFGLGLK
jgi:hypothetical protein